MRHIETIFRVFQTRSNISSKALLEKVHRLATINRERKTENGKLDISVTIGLVGVAADKIGEPQKQQERQHSWEISSHLGRHGSRAWTILPWRRGVKGVSGREPRVPMPREANLRWFLWDTFAPPMITVSRSGSNEEEEEEEVVLVLVLVGIAIGGGGAEPREWRRASGLAMTTAVRLGSGF